MEGSSASLSNIRRSQLALGARPARATAFDMQFAVKRGLDMFGATMFLVVFCPLLIGVAVLALALQGRPILFGHARIGRGGRSFKCYKFRTMVADGERVLADHFEKNPQAKLEWENSRKLRDDPRVTPLGRTLRKLSVDELPQFLNVLRGEMSLVGPRPIVEAETRFYGSQVDAYLSVRPGITGLWQVSGRSNTSYEERVGMDVDYVASWSLRKDLAILARTIPAVLSSDGSC